MLPYIAIHYNGIRPTFAYMASPEAARLYLSQLLTNRQADANDLLTIVRAIDDQIVYFGRRNNTVDKLKPGATESSFSFARLWQSIRKRVRQ
ncbi:hypothetical protein DYU11_17395 [Fibrisoma montanum]|uniref:Uncharacterized protein n=1 Tax=Fibrisoma montanum TaxID=2305895 RepID=A0A418M5T2_9BACT|nr:hypothetical protein [Fibrisoma montanum]RIV21201.1 hypothetical protein DYU11_17395 [Fibrisoma montanum]